MRVDRWMPTILSACLVTSTVGHSLPAWAAGVSVDEANWKQKADAKLRYRQGKTAFDGGKFEDALKGFEKSYDIVASPNSHLMVARTLIKLGRKLEAYQALDVVIEEAKAAKDQEKYAKTAEAARVVQEELKSELVFITVQMGASATINGQEVTPQRWGEPIPMEPGTFDVVLKTGAAGEERKKLTLKAGETATVSPTPPKPKTIVQTRYAEDGTPILPEPVEPGVSYRTLTWVSAGVGLAGLATFTIFGLANNSQHSDLQSACPGNQCPESLADSAETGRTYQHLANVGLGVGLVGLGTAAALLLFSSPSPKSPETPPPAAAARVVIGPRFVSVTGGF